MKNGKTSMILNSRKISIISDAIRCKHYITATIMITSLRHWLKIKLKYTLELSLKMLAEVMKLIKIATF